MDIVKLLTLIAAVESNSGQNLNHRQITNTHSIHYGTSAISQFGIMPRTLASLGTTDPLKGSKLLARRIGATTGCLDTALILWYRGPHHRVTIRDHILNRTRLDRAYLELKRSGISVRDFKETIVDKCY